MFCLILLNIVDKGPFGYLQINFIQVLGRFSPFFVEEVAINTVFVGSRVQLERFDLGIHEVGFVFDGCLELALPLFGFALLKVFLYHLFSGVKILVWHAVLFKRERVWCSGCLIHSLNLHFCFL